MTEVPVNPHWCPLPGEPERSLRGEQQFDIGATFECTDCGQKWTYIRRGGAFGVPYYYGWNGTN